MPQSKYVFHTGNHWFIINNITVKKGLVGSIRDMDKAVKELHKDENKMKNIYEIT